MCFFDQNRFTCGDWKWGHFRQHCAREYRIGETCGMKLIMQTVPVGVKCKLCEKIDAKMRRRTAEVERISRWQREGSKFRASIDKSIELIKDLDGDIYDLSCERNRRLQGIGGHAGDAISDSDFEPDEILECRMIEKKDILIGLPITFESAQSPATVMANPDSGACANAITTHMAKKLGLIVQKLGRKTFRLMNGRFAWCCGIVEAWCRFGKTYQTEIEPIKCSFFVFDKLASPLIMSGQFLRDTETLTRYRHRLVQLTSIFRCPVIRMLGDTQDRLLCSLDGDNVEALPDSGSDIDVISLSYARKRGFSIEPNEEWVMLADRTVQKTIGSCSLQLVVGFGVKKIETKSALQEGTNNKLRNGRSGPVSSYLSTATKPGQLRQAVQVPRPQKPYRNVIESKFRVLDGIDLDVIVGVGSLENLEVYTRHTSSLVTRPSLDDDPGLVPMYRIALLGTLEQKLRQISRTWNARMKKNSHNRTPIPFRQILSEADQKENARRELVRETLDRLEGVERTKAESDEKRLQSDYDTYREMLLQAHCKALS